jgi:hypothetical protein
MKQTLFFEKDIEKHKAQKSIIATKITRQIVVIDE